MLTHPWKKKRIQWKVEFVKTTGTTEHRSGKLFEDSSKNHAIREEPRDLFEKET